MRFVSVLLVLCFHPWPARAQGRFAFDVPTTAALTVAAAWLLFALWTVIRSARIRAQAETAQAWGLRLRGLLATVPEAYLIVGDEGRVTTSDTLRSWLRLDRVVAAFSELAPDGEAGFEGEGFTALEAAIAATAVSGAPFTLPLESADGRSKLLASGRAAPPEVAGARGVVIWFADTTEADARLLEMETTRTEEINRSEAARAMIAAAPVPVWRRDRDLNLVEVNNSYAEAVEAETPAIAVAAQMELLTGTLTLLPRAAARLALQKGELQLREETTVVGGERRRLRIANVPLASGEVAGFALDVTERDEARSERDRYAEAQAEMFERLSAGVVRFNAERHLKSANQAFQRLFQIDDDMLAEEPQFERVLEHMREARRLPEQRDFPSWKAARRDWFLSADSGIEETWVLPDNMVLRVLAQPTPDGGLLLIFEDQSERLRLASSRDQLVRVQDATLQNLHEAVAVFGVSGRLQFHNIAFRDVWHLPQDMMSENPHVDTLFAAAKVGVRDGDAADMMRGLISASTDGRKERTGLLELDDGRYLRFAAVPLPDGNALFTFIDMTDSERVEIALRDRNEALEAADEAKSRFVESMSYELRTPLTAIAGFGELLQMGIGGDLNEKQADYVDSILTSADRLRTMINSIIDLSVSDAQGLALEREEVDIAALLRSIKTMSENGARDRGVGFDLHMPDDMGHVPGDPVRLKQALYNLVSNAIRFTPEGGDVTIRAAGSARDLTINVTDTGIGIPRDEQDLVFERFQKGSNSGATQGVGLGLSLVKEIVLLHGGTLDMNSTVGKGTEMRLTLPRRAPAPVASEVKRS
ncbi:MAG: ATP-binding protein [Pacificimonas sp.]